MIEGANRGGRVLIVGSGLSIHQLDQLDTRAWIVVALNHAWRYSPEVFHYLVHSEALPGSARPSPGLFPPGHVLSYAEYHPCVRECASRVADLCGDELTHPAMYLTGHLIHFNASYWALLQLRPRLIAYLGCDFDYSHPEQTHYYGKGQAVFAMERGRAPLTTYFQRQTRLFAVLGVALFNLSTASRTLLPYPRLDPTPWRRQVASSLSVSSYESQPYT